MHNGISIIAFISHWKLEANEKSNSNHQSNADNLEYKKWVSQPILQPLKQIKLLHISH